MRSFFIASLLLATALDARAQVQEQKLVDRLLRPDTNLQNSAQGKQFSPGGSLSAKTVGTKSFYVATRTEEKTYSGVPQVKMKAFSLRDSTLALPQANLKTRTSLTSLQRPYSIPSNYATHQTIDARKTVATSNYSDTRPFLVHGKSEKSLSAPNRPMTIDEVRELLNKNK